jgi:hypothetical protein
MDIVVSLSVAFSRFVCFDLRKEKQTEAMKGAFECMLSVLMAGPACLHGQ